MCVCVCVLDFTARAQPRSKSIPNRMKAARDVSDFQYEGIGRQEHTVKYNAISEAIKRSVRGFGMSGMSLLYVGRQVSGSMKCAPGERCRQQLIPRDGDGRRGRPRARCLLQYN